MSNYFRKRILIGDISDFYWTVFDKKTKQNKLANFGILAIVFKEMVCQTSLDPTKYHYTDNSSLCMKVWNHFIY